MNDVLDVQQVSADNKIIHGIHERNENQKIRSQLILQMNSFLFGDRPGRVGFLSCYRRRHQLCRLKPKWCFIRTCKALFLCFENEIEKKKVFELKSRHWWLVADGDCCIINFFFFIYFCFLPGAFAWCARSRSGILKCVIKTLMKMRRIGCNVDARASTLTHTHTTARPLFRVYLSTDSVDVFVNPIYNEIVSCSILRSSSLFCGFLHFDGSMLQSCNTALPIKSQSAVWLGCVLHGQ